MKKITLIILVFVVLSCGNNTKNTNTTTNNIDINNDIPKIETIDKFGEKIFTLIQSDNYTKILDLMPDLKKYETLIKNSALTDGKKETMLHNLESTLKNNIELLKKTYSRVRKQAEEAGIDWTKSKLNYIDYIHTKEDKIENADIFLNFSFKGVNYKIELNDCVKINNIWFIGNKINWRTHSNSYYDDYPV